MNLTCAWCPACLAARPEVELDNVCPDHRGSWCRAERLDLSYSFACTHHRTTTSGETVPTYGVWTPVDKHPGVGGAKNKRRPTRRARPKKSQR